MSAPRAIELATAIQASMDELAGIVAGHDPELAAPALERVLAGAVAHAGRWRQSDLYWIVDEALRRTHRRR